jgi:hypothetical protein
VVQHDVLSRYENGTGLVMSTMKVTLDAAMRARDVSPPALVDQSTGDVSTGDVSTGDVSTGDVSTGDGGPETAVRQRGGEQP